jgi:hypothetical protein
MPALFVFHVILAVLRTLKSLPCPIRMQKFCLAENRESSQMSLYPGPILPSCFLSGVEISGWVQARLLGCPSPGPSGADPR